jgi:hypothetical protein
VQHDVRPDHSAAVRHQRCLRPNGSIVISNASPYAGSAFSASSKPGDRTISQSCWKNISVCALGFPAFFRRDDLDLIPLICGIDEADGVASKPRFGGATWNPAIAHRNRNIGRSGITSQSKGAGFSINQMSCSKAGPRGLDVQIIDHQLSVGVGLEVG